MTNVESFLDSSLIWDENGRVLAVVAGLRSKSIPYCLPSSMVSIYTMTKGRSSMSLAIEQESSAAISYEPEGYLMIEKLRIENFRCFKSVFLEGLRRVNIIVGRNASGKTVLLESIKLGLDGLPGQLPWLNQMRNIPMFFPPIRL